MNNLREVNDDILKDWLEFREETLYCTLSAEDKKHFVYFDEISERILKNVPEQNKKYVEKQLKQLDDNFFFLGLAVAKPAATLYESLAIIHHFSPLEQGISEKFILARGFNIPFTKFTAQEYILFTEV